MPKQKSNSGSGWKDVQQGGLAPFVVWSKKGQTVEGIVGNHRSYTYKKKKHQAMEIINTSTGETVAITDNFALAPLIKECKKGDQVRIVYEERIKLKGRQTMLVFSKVQRKAA